MLKSQHSVSGARVRSTHAAANWEGVFEVVGVMSVGEMVARVRAVGGEW